VKGRGTRGDVSDATPVDDPSTVVGKAQQALGKGCVGLVGCRGWICVNADESNPILWSTSPM
jgi:hypothetical protein